MPTNIAARMTLAADPGSLQGAVAAGILGCGPVILGTAELCAKLLAEAQARVDGGGEAAVPWPTTWRRRSAPRAARLPGFGHPVHKPLDPRAERILAAGRRSAASAAPTSHWRGTSATPRPRPGASR